MKSPEEILTKAKLEAEKLKNANEVVARIYMIMDSLGKRLVRDWSVDELSSAISELAILNINLADIVAEATLEANSAYAYRKFRYSKEYKTIMNQVDSKVKDSELDAQIAVSEDLEKELLAQYRADVLKGLYDSVDKFISVVQTRLRRLEGERIQGRLN